MDGNKSQLISEFCSVADVSEERAKFFLESSQWQLQIALCSFYDAGPQDHADDNMDDGLRDANFLGEAAFDEDEFNLPTSVPPTQPIFSVPEPKFSVDPPNNKPAASVSAGARKTSRFASIHDYKDEEEGNDDDEGQRFYAGGSEHSGELIVGPPKKKTSNESIASNLFKEAKKHGAQTIDVSSSSSRTESSASRFFQGGGYRLGDTQQGSEFVEANGASNVSPPQSVNVMLRLWSNGFTVDEGELRRFQDPANQQFLESVKKGEIPRELLRMSKGGEVHVDMEDHRHEEFKPPKKNMVPFSGRGQMLGSPAPTVTAQQLAAVGDSSVDPPVVVDHSKSKTVLQIRLSDGRRIKQEFNHTHRVSDIRRAIIHSHPEQASQNFILMTTFPNKVLQDESVTLEDANLLNAMVTQKPA